MEKYIRFVCSVIVLTFFSTISFGTSGDLEFTQNEKRYIDQNQGKELSVGLDPLSGMDYFITEGGQEFGLVLEVLELIEEETGLKFKIVADRTWNEVYEGLHSSEIDILFGANETEERLKAMSFTEPLYEYPYVIFTNQSTEMYSIGDLDNQRVGFMEGDFVVDVLAENYIHLSYQPIFYRDQEALFQALNKNTIDAAVFSGGSIIYKFLYEHPELMYVAPIDSIVSSLTFSVKKENQVLDDILDKVIDKLRREGKIQEKIDEVTVEFIREIIHLTADEKRWLLEDGVVNVGITKDYLPIDYFELDQYLGVSGAVFSEISKLTGMKMVLVYDEFNTLHDGLLDGRVDILNIVRTEERESYLNFSTPYSYERDIIVGLRTAEEVLDVYGLEGKRVAVVDGFWHEAYLKKNLLSVDIVKTQDIVGSMNAVLGGQADYFIENPTVVKYYINTHEAHELLEKGVTSSDSYLYYGVTKRKVELLSIINKVLPIIDLDAIRKTGYQSVPVRVEKKREMRLLLIIIMLITVIGFIVVKLRHVLEELVSSQATTEILKQRQILEYTDVMTGLKNRNYFYKEIEPRENLSSGSLGILICDIDKLKYVNDHYGHPSGDQLIIEVAHLLQSFENDDVVVIRMGGDEFLMLLATYDQARCRKLTELIEDEVRQLKIETDDGFALEVLISMGYAVRAQDESFDQVILRADNNMYLNKKRRKS